MDQLAEFVKTRRKQLGMTQEEFADKAGVALTVIRKIEQGKENLNLSKVNHVLSSEWKRLSNPLFHTFGFFGLLDNILKQVGIQLDSIKDSTIAH